MIVIDACLYCSTSSSSPSVCQDAGHGMDMEYGWSMDVGFGFVWFEFDGA